jgi:peptidoglycan/LPS O-acetylase OafA/YrhL
VPHAPAPFKSIDSNFVDGMRGLSAIAVALYHTVLFTGLTGAAALAFPDLYSLLRNGYLGVPIFIVLSGFVLMLPVIRGGSYQLPKGFKHYFMRRFRRIVPPYWAALFLSIALIAAVPLLQAESGTKWDDKIPVTAEAIFGHVLLIQNFIGGMTTINGPMWSVAIEWQIYFLMPLLLLPLWRRFGAKVAIVITAVLTLSPSAIASALSAAGVNSTFPTPPRDYEIHHPWFLLLFAFGMLAAELATNARVQAKWFWVPVVPTTYIMFAYADLANAHREVSETLVGASTALLVVWFAKNGSSVFARLLASKPAVRLGNMSYSIYLIHSPLLALGNLLLLPLKLEIGLHLALMFCLVLPISLVISWMFHYLVERRFMTAHQSELRGQKLA